MPPASRRNLSKAGLWSQISEGFNVLKNSGRQSGRHPTWIHVALKPGRALCSPKPESETIHEIMQNRNQMFQSGPFMTCSLLPWPCFAYIALRYHVVASGSHAQSEPIGDAFAPVDCLTRCKSSAAALRVYVTAMTPWSETEVKHATAWHRCTLLQHLTLVFHRSVGMPIGAPCNVHQLA